MSEDRGAGAAYGYSGDQDDEQDLPPSPKHHKKDTKRYVAFRSDEEDSSEVDFEESHPRKERKKLKKENRSNTFKDKFKSIKVKKREKENKEKSKDKEKEKEEKKEKKEKKKQHKRSASQGAPLAPLNIQSPPAASPVFGVPLSLAVARSKLADGIELPTIFRQCIQYLEEKGLDQEGIYRVSGVKSKIEELKHMYDHGQKINFEADDIEPNLIAGLLKQYLRELPANILTPKLQPVFDALIGIRDEAEKVDKMKQLLAELPKPNITMLSWLFVHLDHVMKMGSYTKMNIQNISIVFSPTMNISHGVLYIIMTHIDELFPDVEIVKYVEPVTPKELPVIPNSPKSIEKELTKQEVFLDNLHEQMKQEGANEEEVMEQMWEMQRKVTQLKRKLKNIRKTQLVRSSTEDNPASSSMEAKAEDVTVEPEPTEMSVTAAPVVIPPAIAPPAPVVIRRKLSRQADMEDGKEFEEKSVRGAEDMREQGVKKGRAGSTEGRDRRMQGDRRDHGERGRADSRGQSDGRVQGDRGDQGERGRADSRRQSDGRMQGDRGDLGERGRADGRGKIDGRLQDDWGDQGERGRADSGGKSDGKREQADRPGRVFRREQGEKRQPGDKKVAEKKKLVEMAKRKDSSERADDVEVAVAIIDTGKREKTERKLESKRKQRRNEEHNRIMELSKEETNVEEDVAVVAEADTADERHVDHKVVAVEKESEKGEEEIVDGIVQYVDSADGIDDCDDDEQTDDEEITELLREEFRLRIEQEELLALSERLKERVQREWNDVDRLQLELDEIRKREDYVTPTTSSDEDSSPSSSDSESGTDSDSDNSELENILKELQKENEKLENQTVDLLKALTDENDLCVQLNVEIRMLEECKI